MRIALAMLASLALLLARPAPAQDKPKDGEAADRQAAGEAARKKLDAPLAEVKFDGVALNEAVEFLCDMTGATIYIDRAAFEKAKLSTTKPVGLEVGQDTKLGEVLKTIAAHAGDKENPGAVDAVGSVIVISTKDGAKAFVERHRKALARGAVGGDAPDLGKALPEVTFKDVAFDDIVQFLQDVTGALIEVDWKSLADAGVMKNQRVNMRARELKVSQALRLVLDDITGEKPLDFAAKGKRVIITQASALDEAEKKLKRAAAPGL